MLQQNNASWVTSEILQDISPGTMITLTRVGVICTVECNAYSILDYIGTTIDQIPRKVFKFGSKTIDIYPGMPIMYLDFKYGNSWNSGGYRYTEEKFQVLIQDFTMPLILHTTPRWPGPIVQKLKDYNLEKDATDFV